jgi:hypothetical protein
MTVHILHKLLASRSPVTAPIYEIGQGNKGFAQGRRNNSATCKSGARRDCQLKSRTDEEPRIQQMNIPNMSGEISKAELANQNVDTACSVMLCDLSLNPNRVNGSQLG